MDNKRKYNRRDFVRQGFKGLASLVGELEITGTTDKKADDTDPRTLPVMSAMAEFPGDGTQISAFIARPEALGTYPAVIVIHEIFGLGSSANAYHHKIFF